MLNVVPTNRPPEKKQIKKLIVFNRLSPGDGVMLTAAIRDLHMTVPEVKIDVRVPFPDLFLHNPYLTKLDHTDPEVFSMEAHYPGIHQSNMIGNRFIYAFHEYFEEIFNRKLIRGPFAGDIHLSAEEKTANIAVEKYGIKGPYWLIQHGCKSDFSVKLWSTARMQKVVDAFAGKIQFVQIGRTDIKTADKVYHSQVPLANVINLIDQTTLRDMINLVYRAEGCLGPESLMAHLAAGIQIPTTSEVVTHKIDTVNKKTFVDWMCKACDHKWQTNHAGCYELKDFVRNPYCPQCGRNIRANVVISSGMASPHWLSYGRGYISKCGSLKCTQEYTTNMGISGGCWRNRVEKLNDGHEKDTSLCRYPLKILEGNIEQTIPKCMDLISAEEVIAEVASYYQAGQGMSTLGPYSDGSYTITK
jgi:hypothetical protein